MDSNLIIDYCWHHYFSESATRERKSTLVLERGFQGDFEPFVSSFALLEVYVHFRDWYLMGKVIQSGFGFREFTRERKRFTLSEDQQAELDNIVADLRESPYLNYVEMDVMRRPSFETIDELVRNYLDYLDAVHVTVAIETRCKKFITKDSDLRSRYGRLSTRGIIQESMVMLSPTRFLVELGK